MNNKYCFIIVGPTAVGKTDLSLHLAKELGTEILSADSRQCYKELNVGVAKPTEKELSQIQHYFISTHSILENVNAKIYQEYADQFSNKILLEHNSMVMVGGTGLYIKAFEHGLDDIPQVDKSLVDQLTLSFKEKGISWLMDQIEKIDPEYFKFGEIKNPQRSIRALSVKLSTGDSIFKFYKTHKRSNQFNIIKIGLELPRELLNQRINNRVELMIENGLVEEAEALLPFKNLVGLQTVGYTELFKYFEKQITLKDAIQEIKNHTRQYAKRQMTWFKKDSNIIWLNATSNVSESLDKILSHIHFKI